MFCESVAPGSSSALIALRGRRPRCRGTARTPRSRPSPIPWRASRSRERRGRRRRSARVNARPRSRPRATTDSAAKNVVTAPTGCVRSCSEVTGARLAPAPRRPCSRSASARAGFSVRRSTTCAATQRVAGQAVAARVEAVAAAEREPGHADGRAGAVHDGAPAPGERRDQLDLAQARARQHAAVGEHLDAAQPPQVEHDAARDGRGADVAVAARAHAHREPARARDPQGGREVAGVERLCDGRRAHAGVAAVEDGPEARVGGTARQQDRAAHRRGQRGQRGRRARAARAPRRPPRRRAAASA